MFSGLINFNELFTSYAKSKDPDFGVIYGVDYKIRENDGKVDTDGDGDIDTDDVRKKDIYGADLVNENSYIQIGNYLSEDMVLYANNKYTQVVGCYDKISAVIEFGSLGISSSVTCISADLDTDFCKCNVLVPYTQQLWIRISGYWYPFNVILNKPQIMIISKEESQDQVQVYIEEIIQENPGDKEERFRASCDSLTPSGGFCYSDPNNINIDTMVDYCENLAVTCKDFSSLGCEPRCDLFKRGRCEDVSYCEWKVGNKCECSGEATCSDNIKNQDETDVDCGGTICGKCEIGKKCKLKMDCTTDYCDISSLLCQDQPEGL